MMTDQENRSWQEYDSAAEYLAKRGLKGTEGDPLPTNLSVPVLNLINADPDAFAERVRATAYAIAMERHNLPD